MSNQERKKYFLQQYLHIEYLHGGVGGTDAEKILISKGFEAVQLPHQRDFSLKSKLGRLLFLLKTFFSSRSGSVIVFLFPVYAKMGRILIRWLKKKNVRVICFIADINGLKDGNGELLKKEIGFFRQFDHFIVHNDAMKEWLKKNVSPQAHTATIEFFDFLTTAVAVQRSVSPEIVFAGNLEKSLFLEKLHLLKGRVSSLHFNLYGTGISEKAKGQVNVTYHGISDPYDLPGKLNGSFGLLWDGDSIGKPGGSLGDYMRYISHHKLSLYILSGLPVILPASAGSAPLVESYRIGFTINDLYELEEKIRSISASEYRQMQANMVPLAEKISRGECLGNAIDKLLKGV